MKEQGLGWTGEIEFLKLANIIWGEASESGDHIVPYPEASDDYLNKKEWNQEAATIKPTEQRTPGAKIDFHGRQQESSSNLESNEDNSASGFGMESWPGSLSHTAKTDQDSIETAEIDKDAKLFQNTHEDKEQRDFVDYGWANIGSFDDLDRIFSNDDSIFGHASLGNADEIWSSSKDVANSPVKTFPVSVDSPSLRSGEVRTASKQLEIKTEYVEQIDLDTVEKTCAMNTRVAAENVVTPNELVDKASRRKKLLKCRKKSEKKNEGKTLQQVYVNWSRNPSGQFENQLAHSMLQSPPSSMLSKQRLLPGPESLQYQHNPNSFVAPSAYGNLTNPYPAMPVISHIQSGDRKHQSLLSGYEGSPGGVNLVSKSMTPQEKIEKLRRRQQMQAMLAIQKQQQQFSHQVPCTNHSITQKCSQENQTQHFEEADFAVEDISTLPAPDPNSPMEQDDSHTVSVEVDYYSVEDTILYRLQDIISKLDIKLRLCIRDSLYRLAQSAMQRHYASDTNSTNKSSRDEHKVVAKEEMDSCDRYAGMPDMETETNPIDRTVAHLLFHRPLELSGKHPDTPEFPIATKLPSEHKTTGLLNLPMGCLPESSKNNQNFPHQGSKNSCPLAEPHHVDQFKNNPSVDTSENASNNRLADGVVEVEASQ